MAVNQGYAPPPVPQDWERIRAGIFAGESGGDYNALFGYSNRPGGRYANTRLTDMTVDEALNFANPSGDYGQWVRGQVGRVATPMGAYQVVGTTLRAAKEALGLTGNERMTPELQDQIGQWILAEQGTGAWEGYRGPRDPSEIRVQGDSEAIPVPQSVVDAYATGQMTPEEESLFLNDLAAGNISTPEPLPPRNITPEQTQSVYQAYTSGQMPEGARMDYERDVRLGIMPLPAGATLQSPEMREGMATLSELSRPERTEPTTGQTILRQLGLTARYAAQGLGGMVGIVTDPMDFAVSQVTGLDQPPPLRERVSNNMDRLGLPSPETGVERVVGAASEGMVGAGTAVGVSRALAGLPGLAGRAAGVAAEAPGAQVFSGGGSGGGGQAAAEAGMGAVGQIGGSLLGGGLGYRRPRQQEVRLDPDVPPQAAEAPSQGMPPGDAPRVSGTPSTDETEQMWGLIKRAYSGGRDGRRALEELADLAAVNPEARAAAERLGFELPPDVFSDNPALRQALGLIRGQRGTDSAVQWRNDVERAVEQAGSVLQEMGGARSIDDISDRVYRSLDDTRADLQGRADELYTVIDDTVAPSAPATLDSLDSTLQQLLSDLGGDVDRFSSQEKRLLEALGNGMTYAGLMREKRLIGQALERNSGPYADADRAALSRLYGALVEDQMATVREVGGEEAAQALSVANDLVSQRKNLEDQIVAAFGKDLEGSIASRIRLAMGQASRGDATNLNRMMRLIPEDLRSDAIMSGIGAVAESTINGERGFGFAQYTNFYSSLRDHPRIYSEISRRIGPENEELLRGLYTVSRRITESRGDIARTGETLQIAQRMMAAEGLVSRVLQAPATRSAGAAGAGAVAGSVIGGPMGGAAGAGLGSAIASGMKSNPPTVAAAGRLFTSEQFIRLTSQLARGEEPTQNAIRAVARSRQFRLWAETSGISNPEEWLVASIIAVQQQEAQ